jgi:TolB-like protein/Tfp pilus assembly protein PilF
VLAALERLRKRKLVEWALAYLAGAWLLMQLVDVLSDRWPVPMGVQRGIDLLLLVGFFVALTLAWYHGEKGKQRVAGPELLILAVLLFVAGTLLLFLRSGDGPVAVDDRVQVDTRLALDVAQGIAVLPFRNLSGDSEQEYFVAGMHEALITSLSQIRDLRVISRTSAMRYAETDKSMPEIAAELQVDSLIEGSVNTVGDTVRITVQLINGQTDGHIWGAEYDRELRDVLVLLSQIAESVAGQVEVSLAPDVAEMLRSAESVNPELHDLYMRGRYAYGSFTRQGLARAVEYFEKAIQIDPEYAPAWAGLSGAHILAGYLGYVAPSEGMADAERAAVRALTLDSQLSIAHTSLGWVRLLEFEWEAARAIFERALRLNPNDVDALHGLGDYLTITGDADAGLQYVRRARSNDPFSPVWGHSVLAHLHLMRRFEEVIAESQEVLDIDPRPVAWWIRGFACWELGRYEEAITNFREAMSHRPKRLNVMETGYSKDGPAGAVRAIADASASAARESGTAPLFVALWFARAGDADETMQWLEQAYELKSPDLIYVGVRPELDFLHSDVRFQDLLARMGLKAL